jgi:hypothetical protein
LFYITRLEESKDVLALVQTAYNSLLNGNLDDKAKEDILKDQDYLQKEKEKTERKERQRQKELEAAMALQKEIREWLLQSSLDRLNRERVEKELVENRKKEAATRKIQACARMYIAMLEQSRKTQAILLLQSLVRGWQARRDFSHKLDAVITIQSYIKGLESRVEYVKLKNVSLEVATCRNEAAITLQKVFRGRKERLAYKSKKEGYQQIAKQFLENYGKGITSFLFPSQIHLPIAQPHRSKIQTFKIPRGMFVRLRVCHEPERISSRKKQTMDCRQTFHSPD